MSEAGQFSVFISYSREDFAIADQLDATLIIGGFATTLDRRGIDAGEDWRGRLGVLIRDSDTVVFILTPSSARSSICAWEVEEAVRLGKRILPIVPSDLGDAKPPPGLAALNYILLYPDPKYPGSGFGPGVRELAEALKTDLGWLREHTRLLQRASEWDTGGRTANRLLSGADIAAAKEWAALRPRDAPPPTPLHLEYIRASEGLDLELKSERVRQLAEREKLVREAEIALRRAEIAQAAREVAQIEVARLAKESEDLAVREAVQAKRVTRRTMIGLFVAMFFALGASLAGCIAYFQWQHATRSLQLAGYEKELANYSKQQAELAAKIAFNQLNIGNDAADLDSVVTRAESFLGRLKLPISPILENPPPAAIHRRVRPLKPFDQMLGSLLWPSPDATSVIGFGVKTQYGGTSKGTVYEMKPLADVIAPADGWVIYSGEFRSYGQIVIMDLDDHYTLVVAGLAELRYSFGAFVTSGSVIGRMSGSVNQDSVPHPIIYAELRKNGIAIDPGPWFRK